MKMQELMDKVGQAATLTACDVGEYAAFKAKGMKVSVQQYRLGDWGSIGVMACGGLMSRSFVVVNSMTKDVPVLVCQYASALGKHILQVDLLDVLKNKSAAFAFSAIADMTERVGKEVGGPEDWYEDMKLDGSCKLSGSKKALDELCAQVVLSYVETAATAHDSNHLGYRADKLRKLLEGVFEEGGFAYDAFAVCLKKDKAEDLYSRILFGVEECSE